MKYNFLRWPGGREKAVTLSYDDGPKADFQFTETINKYHLKCTYNLVDTIVESGQGLTTDFIRQEILCRGHEIANHGYDHRAQGVIRNIEGIQDVLNSRLSLEKRFGIIIRGFAYPDKSLIRSESPDTYIHVKNYLKDLDIAYARTASRDNDQFELPEDWYNWMPTAHHANPKLMEYIDHFLELDLTKLYIAVRSPKLFYLWGHAFEYEQAHNWELLDEICQKLSGHDDIWYATNMEIYEYVQAYRSLIYSADGTTVYNPTLFEIWFDIDGKLYNIKSGETKRTHSY